jgi:sirohydrochlorin cobaltochelatase
MTPRSTHLADGLLLVAHGSRDPEGVAEAKALGVETAHQLTGLDVDLGFLELADPSAGRVVDEMVMRGCQRITVQPLMLLSAGHGKNDVPAIVIEARDRHPHVDFHLGSALGVVPELLAISCSNLERARAVGLPLLVIARGTSDPDANAEAYRAARLMAEWSGAPDVEVGFTGVTWPTVPEALARMGRLGHRRIGVFSWFLATGLLVRRAKGQVATFADETGSEIRDAGYFGPHPGLVPVIAQRRNETLDGLARVNCDTCTYRAPWPGLGHRVGQPRGIGHSLLAAEHGHGHTHEH